MIRLRASMTLVVICATSACSGEVAGSVYTRDAVGAGIGQAGVLVTVVPQNTVKTFLLLCEALHRAPAPTETRVDLSSVQPTVVASATAEGDRTALAIRNALSDLGGSHTWTDVDGRYSIRGIKRGPAFLIATDHRNGRNYVWLAFFEIGKAKEANLNDDHLVNFKNVDCPVNQTVRTKPR